jgi:hypothetical protein
MNALELLSTAFRGLPDLEAADKLVLPESIGIEALVKTTLLSSHTYDKS